MRKYKKGDLITSLDEFAQQEFVWMHDKVYHKGWAQSWRFLEIYRRIHGKDIYKAAPIGGEVSE